MHQFDNPKISNGDFQTLDSNKVQNFSSIDIEPESEHPDVSLEIMHQQTFG